MRKINKMDVMRLVLVLALVAGIGLAFGSVGRFVPTHKIVQPVYCGSCHPEQVQELSATTHLGKFMDEVTRFANKNPMQKSARTNARLISGGCMLCHNYWENFKWYGVRNFDLQAYDIDNPNISKLNPPTDIYGNPVSPYGLGSTKEYYMNISYNGTSSLSAEPWTMGLDTYQYNTTDPITLVNTTHSRIDYVWSALSAVSPGPVGFIRNDEVTGAQRSCAGGTVEHGMCHIATSALIEAFADQKNEVMDYPNNTKFFSNDSKVSGKGIFFTHEMAFTTAQYAAKPVKICGACHVMKLPPMQWGGEPWAIVDVQAVGAANPTSTAALRNALNNTDPFGFRPTYNNLVGAAGDAMIKEKNSNEATNKPAEYQTMPVAFRTPDWAHANVPCIRCHAHAGINGDTVSDNPR